jgi:molybdopterin-containing oxidoreductase family membrane subunit
MRNEARKDRRLLAASAALLGGLVILGVAAYTRQLDEGLRITGLSRHAPWGLYIAQFTFLVGVAASAVMVVLPYSLHHYAPFARLAVLGELMSLCALVMAMLFVFVDMGHPARVLNVLIHPSPRSMMFWDYLVLFGYLLLNAILWRTTLVATRTGVAPPAWFRPLVYLSIPLAFAIHTVTALLFAGLSARPAWLTAILAPRFLASAFASGPALLILLALALRRTTRFDVEQAAVSKLAELMTYAMVANVFFAVLELFTALYSGTPEHAEHFEYLFFGLLNRAPLAPWMWIGSALALVSLSILLVPAARRRETLLALASVAVVSSVWIDKGLCLVISGFVPSPFGEVRDYHPTLPELAITAGIYGGGLLLLLLLCRVTVAGQRTKASV